MMKMKMWEKCWFGVPIMVTIHLVLAMACSVLWLYSFKQEGKSSSVFLVVAYASHLPVLVILPFCSRPWLWSKDGYSNSARVLLWGILGWDDGGAHWSYCLLEGLRAVAVFLLAWAPFVFAVSPSRWSLAGILGLALEGFFAAEMVKHTEAEDSFFMCQMAVATYAAQRLFGLGGPEWWIVFSSCVSLIALHSVFPLYDHDLSTLLPEPYCFTSTDTQEGQDESVC